MPIASSSPTEILTWILPFIPLRWCIRGNDFHLLYEPCIPRINPMWSWYLIFSARPLVQLVLFVVCFVSIFIMDACWQVSCDVSGWYFYQEIVASYNELGNVIFSSIFRKNLRRFGASLSMLVSTLKQSQVLLFSLLAGFQ